MPLGIPRWILALVCFIAYTLACMLASLLYRIRYFRCYRCPDPDFLKYSDAFGFWQLTGNWHKSQEAVFFRQADISDPSLELGICRGDISSLHFEGRHFTLGSEYLWFTGAQAAKRYPLWDRVYSDEINHLALKDRSLQTICMVHIVDHLENIDAAMAEVARVLKTGGHVYFSGFSEHHYRVNLLYRILKNISPQAAASFADYLSRRRVHFNFLSEDAWRMLLDRYGLELHAFKYFETGGYAFLRYFLHFVLFHNRCFDSGFFRKPPLDRFFKRLFFFYYVSIGYPAYLNVKKGSPRWGTDFWAAARKR